VIGILISNASAAENAEWFGQRLFDAFAKDAQSSAYQAPAPDASPPQRRIPPAPFDSPPFPSGDWQIGGTPIIGDPGNVGPWPLVDAKQGPNLRLGRFFLESEHIDEHFAWPQRKLPSHLRPAPEPFRAEPIRSLHRARS